MLQGEHSAILSTFIKLPFAIKTFLSIFEWPLKTGYIVFCSGLLFYPPPSLDSPSCVLLISSTWTTSSATLAVLLSTTGTSSTAGLGLLAVSFRARFNVAIGWVRFVLVSLTGCGVFGSDVLGTGIFSKSISSKLRVGMGAFGDFEAEIIKS